MLNYSYFIPIKTLKHLLSAGVVMLLTAVQGMDEGGLDSESKSNLNEEESKNYEENVNSPRLESGISMAMTVVDFFTQPLGFAT